MKIVVGGVLLGAMLIGSAYAAKSDAPAKPLLSKDLSVQSEPATKRKKDHQSRKSKSSGKVGATKPASKAGNLDGKTETSSESADQAVELRGVRG